MKKTKSIFLALLAAVFYAISVPFSKLLLEHVAPTMQAAGAGFSAGTFVGLERFCGGYFLVLGRNARQIAFRRLTGPDSGVDLLRRLFPHLVCHMAVI